MSLDRLTQRAKQVILDVSQGDLNVEVPLLFDEIKKSAGMGDVLLRSFPKIRAKKAQKVSINDLVKGAYYQASKFNQSYVGTEHLLLALLNLVGFNDLEKVEDKLLKTSVFPQSVKSLSSNRKIPLLNSFGISLNHKVVGDLNKPLVFREELNSLVSILLQKKNPNPLIVGESGVGKRTLIELLVMNINNLSVPPALMGHRVIEFDLLGFITNAINKGTAEYSLLSLLDELKSMKRVILSIKGFQNLFFSTNVGVAIPLIYSTFKSALESAGVRCIATLSGTVYTKLISDNEHVINNFSVINLTEPHKEESLAILSANADTLSNHHNVIIPDEIVRYIYEKAKEEIREGAFPQRGIDLMDQACTKLVLSRRKVPKRYRTMLDESILLAEGLDKSLELGRYDAALVIRGEITRIEDLMWIDEKSMFAGRKKKLSYSAVDTALEDYGANVGVFLDRNIGSLSTLADRIKKRIIGQGLAVDAVSKSLIRARLGLRAKKRPLGNFLFLGPTGVGKTELAKILAVEACGENSLIRLDMSDFGEKHNVARLVGAPPGYIGYSDGGELTSKIDLKPESVVLFDEIEKAHPDVLNILLQIMEEGELVDAKGSTSDFSKAVVILTSNLGTDIIYKKGIGFDEKILDGANMEKRLKSNLKKILKPELLNRLDEVVVFKKLSKKDQLEVLDLLILEVRATLKKQSVRLRVGSKAKEHLLKLGYSDEYGARSLRRVMENELLDKIAEILLNTRERPLRLSVGVSGKGLVVKQLLTSNK